MSPTVSIVMPCYNAAAHLPLSVGSVQAQTMQDWELIAVNDGSSDGTLAWLHQQTDPRIRIIDQPNGGVSRARNAGLAEARGHQVAFLDADDTWTPNFLECMSGALDSRPDAVLAYCGWQNLGLPGGAGEPFIPPDYEGPGKAETLFAGCRWPIHAALVRRDAVTRAGGFDTSLKNAEDYALWLRIALDAPIVRVPEVLAHYHFHGASQASSNRVRAALHHHRAQHAYLKSHPQFRTRLGRTRVRQLTLGPILKQAYTSYWKRDLTTARTLFRMVMQHGYGTLRDWLYMLPALLPERWHRTLIQRRDTYSDPS